MLIFEGQCYFVFVLFIAYMYSSSTILPYITGECLLLVCGVSFLRVTSDGNRRIAKTRATIFVFFDVDYMLKLVVGRPT